MTIFLCDFNPLSTEQHSNIYPHAEVPTVYQKFTFQFAPATQQVPPLLHHHISELQRTMFKWTLLLLVALSLLVSIDAITAPAERSAAKLSASSGNYDKRSLRGFMASDETATEERGTAEAAQKLKSMLSTTKLGQKLAASKQARVAKRETFVKKLLDDGADHETLFKNKVTKNEVFNALHITTADSPYSNPGFRSANLKKVIGYSRYIDSL